jgi:hypothetical protein
MLAFNSEEVIRIVPIELFILSQPLLHRHPRAKPLSVTADGRVQTQQTSR